MCTSAHLLVQGLLYISHSLARLGHSCPPLTWSCREFSLWALKSLGQRSAGLPDAKTRALYLPRNLWRKTGRELRCALCSLGENRLWVNLQQVDSSSPDITRTLRLQLPKGNRKVDIWGQEQGPTDQWLWRALPESPRSFNRNLQSRNQRLKELTGCLELLLFSESWARLKCLPPSLPRGQNADCMHSSPQNGHVQCPWVRVECLKCHGA